MLDLLINRYHCACGDIIVSLGPHIQNCCYEVGADVMQRFEQVTETHLDLRREIIKQVTGSGIPIGNIDTAPWCTSDSTELFFSYRKETGTENRMFSVIGKL